MDLNEQKPSHFGVFNHVAGREKTVEAPSVNFSVPNPDTQNNPADKSRGIATAVSLRPNNL